jgi:hypothetical protein
MGTKSARASSFKQLNLSAPASSVRNNASQGTRKFLTELMEAQRIYRYSLYQGFGYDLPIATN